MCSLGLMMQQGVLRDCTPAAAGKVRPTSEASWLSIPSTALPSLRPGRPPSLDHGRQDLGNKDDSSWSMKMSGQVNVTCHLWPCQASTGPAK